VKVEGPRPTAAVGPVPARTGSRRRRLWELPAASHDLLLAMSLAPAQLHAVVERCLSRLQHAQCQLAGGPADVLYSCVRDLGTRNPLSEALHRELDARHAAAIRTTVRLRDAEALRAAWLEALAGTDVPAALWALLTHPLGAALEEAALVDARAWVFAQARAGVAAATRAGRHEQRHAEALADNASLRARLTAAQAGAEQQLRALRSEVAQLRGAQQRVAVVTPVTPVTRSPAGGQAAVDDPVRRPVLPEQAASKRASAATTVQARDLQAAPGAPPGREPAGPRQNWAPSITGQRVLCVGGMPGARRRYQAIVESGGGRFAWHDGGLEDRVQRLEQQLHSADVVVCQAGCLNHEAYRRIKGHCKRLGKSCVYLDRPSLSGFAQCLGLADPRSG
jgi:hypothetical protein